MAMSSRPNEMFEKASARAGVSEGGKVLWRKQLSAVGKQHQRFIMELH
jgi:hypothetical protein